ncbi:pleiotropic regulator 1-like [Centruroides sculpturatus]|uniref:pleiotropic regulator 1-like n=1 Tax=Centruroides sculpturatus TaxID=218467 RepID=UPI000C6E665E|nr:pleiotropic regulator 1-like [Centruroides sculpturatus]
MEEVQKHSVHTLVFRSLKRTHDMFLSDQANPPPNDEKSEAFKLSIKGRDEYGPVMHLVKNNPGRQIDDDMRKSDDDSSTKNSNDRNQEMRISSELDMQPMYDNEAPPPGVDDFYVPPILPPAGNTPNTQAIVLAGQQQQQTIIPKRAPALLKPQWHPPWKLYRVISGHLGWVRCLAVEPGNEWFATGSNDRMIKIWDLASGKLKLSLTGHISAVRGLAISPRQPYLFSCGEDKQVKCWDLEYNKVIRHYHGHLSGVYALALHPTIDILVSGGRDATARVS